MKFKYQKQNLNMNGTDNNYQCQKNTHFEIFKELVFLFL